MKVGVYEAKARLSELLGLVAAGEVVTITKRGRAIAAIVPAEGPQDLEEIGKAPRPALRSVPASYPRLPEPEIMPQKSIAAVRVGLTLAELTAAAPK